MGIDENAAYDIRERAEKYIENNGFIQELTTQYNTQRHSDDFNADEFMKRFKILATMKLNRETHENLIYRDLLIIAVKMQLERAFEGLVKATLEDGGEEGDANEPYDLTMIPPGETTKPRRASSAKGKATRARPDLGAMSGFEEVDQDEEGTPPESHFAIDVGEDNLEDEEWAAERLGAGYENDMDEDLSIIEIEQHAAETRADGGSVADNPYPYDEEEDNPHQIWLRAFTSTQAAEPIRDEFDDEDEGFESINTEDIALVVTGDPEKAKKLINEWTD